MNFEFLKREPEFARIMKNGRTILSQIAEDDNLDKIPDNIALFTDVFVPSLKGLDMAGCERLYKFFMKKRPIILRLMEETRYEEALAICKKFKESTALESMLIKHIVTADDNAFAKIVFNAEYSSVIGNYISRSSLFAKLKYSGYQIAVMTVSSAVGVTKADFKDLIARNLYYDEEFSELIDFFSSLEQGPPVSFDKYTSDDDKKWYEEQYDRIGYTGLVYNFPSYIKKNMNKFDMNKVIEDSIRNKNTDLKLVDIDRYIEFGYDFTERARNYILYHYWSVERAINLGMSKEKATEFDKIPFEFFIIAAKVAYGLKKSTIAYDYDVFGAPKYDYDLRIMYPGNFAEIGQNAVANAAIINKNILEFASMIGNAKAVKFIIEQVPEIPRDKVLEYVFVSNKYDSITALAMIDAVRPQPSEFLTVVKYLVSKLRGRADTALIKTISSVVKDLKIGDVFYGDHTLLDVVKDAPELFAAYISRGYRKMSAPPNRTSVAAIVLNQIGMYKIRGANETDRSKNAMKYFNLSLKNKDGVLIDKNGNPLVIE